MHAGEKPLFAYHSQTKRCDKEELNTCQNEFKMTATQDTNLTSPESRTSQEGVVENSDPAGGSSRPFRPGRAPTPPFPMASRSSSFLPFLVRKLAWDFGVFPDPEFLHCCLLLAHMSQVLFIFQSLLESPGCTNPITRKLS